MQSEHVPVPAETLSLKSDLTFGDGFRFGCGFMAAFVIFWVAFILLTGVIGGLVMLLTGGLPGLVR